LNVPASSIFASVGNSSVSRVTIQYSYDRAALSAPPCVPSTTVVRQEAFHWEINPGLTLVENWNVYNGRVFFKGGEFDTNPIDE
jgi:hypothetical protein